MAAQRVGMIKQLPLRGKIMYKYKQWYDLECRNEKKDLKNTLVNVRKSKDQDFTLYNFKLKQFRNLCKFKRFKVLKFKFWLNSMHEKLFSMSQPGDFWTALREFKLKNIVCKSEITDDDWKLYLVKHFRVDDDEDLINGEFLVALSDLNKDNELMYEIDDNELEDVINELKNNKAAGLNGVTNEMIKMCQ
ncbi:hypothetical protein CHUAL_009557 [Chamberlinius hualienensis]